jgi:hypothetical protein
MLGEQKTECRQASLAHKRVCWNSGGRMEKSLTLNGGLVVDERLCSQVPVNPCKKQSV